MIMLKTTIPRGGAGQCPEACPEGRLDCRTVSCSCPVVAL